MLNKILELGISKSEAQELIKTSKNIQKDYELLKSGYPIQYLIGYVDFFGYRINISKETLIPRYETELLVEKVIKIANNFVNNPKILDIGTGSGAIAISLKKNIDSEIDATDISKAALEVAKKNALNNDISINFFLADIFPNNNCKYDIIVSNPPYISDKEKAEEIVDKYEPHLALYAKEDGLYFYNQILRGAKNRLNKKFIIALEIGKNQAKAISEIAKSHYADCDIVTEQDFSGKDRYVFIVKNN